MKLWILIGALLFAACDIVIPLPPLPPAPLLCSDDPCVAPLAQAELQAGSDGILLQIPTDEALVLFWLADAWPIDRFEAPDWVTTGAPHKFFPAQCGYVVDVMVILPVPTPLDTGGARRLLQAEVICGS